MTGPQLKAWRIRMGWSHDEAARQIGIGRSTLFVYEKAKAVPRVVVLATKALDAQRREDIEASGMHVKY